MQGGANNSEKMVVPSSTTTNNHIARDQKGHTLLEKPNQDQEQQQQHQHLPPPLHPLKCPRCDSLNTKFCYYNNYSLSQPRHYCKACKRYWTKGGTLRNVPVGGGCRKNKRVRRPSSSSSVNEVSSSFSLGSNPNNHHLDLSSSTSNHQHVNKLFYGLPTNSSELNDLSPYTNLIRVDGDVGFDQINNVLGLGFGSYGLLGIDHGNSSGNNTNIFKNGSNPLISSYQVGSVVGSSSSSSSTVASLVASSLQHQNKYISDSSDGFKDLQGGGANGNFHGLLSTENLHSAGNVVEGGGAMMKDDKMEGSQQNRFDWNNSNIPIQQNQIHEQINSSYDPSLWNTNCVGSWVDPSVPSLIQNTHPRTQKELTFSP